jgi:hypothetical protein
MVIRRRAAFPAAVEYLRLLKKLNSLMSAAIEGDNGSPGVRRAAIEEDEGYRSWLGGKLIQGGHEAACQALPT